TRSHATVRLPRAARREQLIRAAASAFLSGGYDKTSMEDVAKAAGVTRLIVYRIFATKEDLYRAVLDSVTDRLRDEVSPELRSGDGQRSGIAGVLLRIAREQPDAFRLLWRHASHEPTFMAEAQAFREVSAEFAEAVIHPYLHDRDFRRWAAISVVAHLYDGVCAWLDSGDPTRDDEFADRLAAGIRALVTAWST
ncbi:MAG TPA: TetR/AcrR family transcriptional regulator, partial [Ilumatobacteraceae bacterium]|nr:TetR/AcrR family transcriptional regulator [Ilumatobacteraceae bacterium]